MQTNIDNVFPAYNTGTVDGAPTQSIVYSAAGGGTVPTAEPPAGYIFDHWETSADELFTLGVTTVNATVHPVYIPMVAYDLSSACVPQSYQSLGITLSTTDHGSVTTGITVNAVTGEFTAPNLTAPPGFKLDYWETSSGASFNFGTVTQPVTVHPVYVTDYSGTILPDNIFVVTQDNFNELVTNHYRESYSGKTIKLLCDVSISSRFIHPDTDFRGTFDGNGHIINANITTGGGIIGINRGTIKNLIADGSIGSSSYQVGGMVQSNYGTITCCVNKASITASKYAGGIAGWNRGGEINQCYNLGNITGVTSSSSYYIKRSSRFFI